ncbi:MAG: NAD(P)H-hydrate dehydratase [Gammaproteobacteria bacterium]
MEVEPLFTAAQVRELDRIAIEESGIPGYTLMSRAGEAAWQLVNSQWHAAQSMTVFCGAGNNGGDGFVVARQALKAGWKVQVLQLGSTGMIKGDAATARTAYIDSGGEITAFDTAIENDADVLVDAMLGTGLERPLEGDWAHAVEKINHSPAPVLAMDIPTGLHADTGRVMGVTVRADHTVTFIGRKQGLYTGQGPEFSGKVSFHGLGVPEDVMQRVPPRSKLLGGPLLQVFTGPRPRTAHKGDHGHVLVIGGDTGMVGAARLAGEAALRTGAGLVSLATRAAHAGIIAASCPELMAHGVESVPDLKALLKRATVVAIGPGLGQSAWARSLLSAVLETSRPLVLDADALNLLAREPIGGNNWVLTPHPGEAARLLQQDTAAIQADRFTAVRALTDKYGGTAVLKGAGTLVHTADQPVAVCTAGNPGMATAGMGDVLSGVIAGLVAQGMTPAQAAVDGVCAHACAGDRAARDGERGLCARDVIAELRGVLNPAGIPE